MTMSELTQTQANYLSFIQAYTEGFGQVRAESEISKVMKAQPPSVNCMLKSLEKKRLVRRIPNTRRSIEILVGPALILKAKKKLVWTFQFYVPADASQGQLDRIAEAIINRRKAERTSNQWQTRIDEKSKSGANSIIYRFKISLKGSCAPIWLRIETPNISLFEFRELIHLAMGWTNSHLHLFDIAGQRYVVARQIDDDFAAVDYAVIRISDLVRQHGPKLTMCYAHDFGDGWQHSVGLENFSARNEPANAYPRCIAGKRVCPPEDVGGVWGYADFLRAIRDPKREQHEELLEWSGAFKPEAFDLEAATQSIHSHSPSD